jgi:glucose/arabinose dehydrogenase
VKSRYLPILAIAAALAWVGAATPTQQAPRRGGLPPGFADHLVGSFLGPTAMVFTPDGRLLVTTQLGMVRVFDPRGHLLTKPALNLSGRICTERERGMSGITVDPSFSRNHYVYIYYTFKKFGGCPVESPRVPVNRLSRFVLRPDNTIDPQSEKPLLDEIPSYGATHNAGDVHFGKDGYIYVGIGDGGRDYARRSDSSAENAAARDFNVLLGKVVRITRSGAVPPTNPFRGRATSCARRGVVSPDLRCGEIYAWGLRNPWRLAFDPDAARTRFFINDVGEYAWEEIDAGRRGADYGWNLREGFCPRDRHTRCTPAPSTMTDPVHAYAHRGACGAITGGAFVPNDAWPARFRHAYLFGDFNCGKIFMLTFSDRRARSSLFDTRYNPGLVSMTFGPDMALYYATYAQGGEVRRISYDSSGGR